MIVNKNRTGKFIRWLRSIFPAGRLVVSGSGTRGSRVYRFTYVYK